LNSLHDFSSWLSIMFFRHDSLSKSNDLHVSLHVSLHVFLYVFLYVSLYVLLYDFLSNNLHVFPSWLSIKKIMQKDNAKVGKISIFSSLDIKLEFLTSQVELTQFSVEMSCVKLKICSTRLKLNWKCEQLNFESSWIQNVNSKLDLMISLSRTYCCVFQWVYCVTKAINIWLAYQVSLHKVQLIS